MANNKIQRHFISGVKKDTMTKEWGYKDKQILNKILLLPMTTIPTLFPLNHLFPHSLTNTNKPRLGKSKKLLKSLVHLSTTLLVLW
jgi:hypothetical protein